MGRVTREELETQKLTLIGYCASKMRAGDWHAVQDSASDIRELDAKIELLDHISRDAAATS